MVSETLKVPQLRVQAPSSVKVTDWGELDGFILRPGDRVVLGGGHGGLVLLVPRGFGRPMFGRVTGRGLVAEPGGVPASAARWSVVSGVTGVERALERGVTPGEGRWALSVEVEGGRDIDFSLDDLRMDGLSRDEVEHRCRAWLVAARNSSASVRVGVARELAVADALAASAMWNHVRMEFGRQQRQSEQGGRVIVGPWPSSDTPETRRQLSLFDLARQSG